MGDRLPIIYMARHGDTAWSLTGQHTGLTDLPLTPEGELTAKKLKRRVKGLTFERVYSSPLQRAWRTCELAGFKDVATIVPDLVEWNYGDYEGLTTAEIRARRPDWKLFRDGCPGGERPTDVAARAERVLTQLRSCGGNVLLFSSGHFMRAIATRWVGLEIARSNLLMLDTASLSALGYEHSLSEPVIRLWNDTDHFNAVDEPC